MSSFGPPLLSGIRDNHRRGAVGDFLCDQLKPGAELDLVTAYFTVFAYDRLRTRLDSLGCIRLLFGEAAFIKNLDPERFVTGAFVKIGFFRSESDLAYHDTIHGDLFTQAARTIDLVRTKYLKAAITYQGIQRIERYPVPDAALREAVLNALVHRDYAMGAPVQIRVYENRLKIWNPGVLPDGWTVRNLVGAHASTPFNPTVANVFFRSGEIETWGRGIQRIFTACKDAGTPRPALTFDGTGLAL
ncbi:MAG: hypothetical protein FJ399_15770, partial [Verrucomicrobia bacterium]|nr:hypothetical protein [Verrucomicrobiota bacterium]